MKNKNKPISNKISKTKKSEPEVNQEQLSQNEQQKSRSADEQNQQQNGSQESSEQQVQRQVYKIHAKQRTRKGQQAQYKVQYVDDKTLEWEFLSNLGHAMDKIQEYEKQHGGEKKTLNNIQLKLTSYANKKVDQKADQKQKIDQQNHETRKDKASAKNKESQEKEVAKKQTKAQTKANKKTKAQNHDIVLSKLKQKLLQKKKDDAPKSKDNSKQDAIKTRRNRKQSEQAKEQQHSSKDEADLDFRQKSKQSKQVAKKPKKKIKLNQSYADKVEKKKRVQQFQKAIQIDSDSGQNQQVNQKEENSGSSKAGGLLSKISRNESNQQKSQKQSQSQKSKKNANDEKRKKNHIKESDHSNDMMDSKSVRVSVLENVNRQQEQSTINQNGKSHITAKYRVVKVLGYQITKKESYERKEIKYKVQIELPNKKKQQKLIIKEQFEEKCLQKLNQFLIEELCRAKFVKRKS